MKREDFNEDELKGLLIAYLDDQLSEEDERAFKALIDEHEDLQVKLEIYRTTSETIKDLFSLEGNSTNLPLEFGFKGESSNPNERVAFDYEPSFTMASQDSHSPPNLNPEPDEVFYAKESNVIRLKQKSRSRFFSFQAISQMAAALIVGVFLGPSLIEQFAKNPVPSMKEPLIIRGERQLESQQLLEWPEPGVNRVEKLRQKPYPDIESSWIFISFKKWTPVPRLLHVNQNFNVGFISPATGAITIFLEEIREGAEPESKIIYEGFINSGEIISLPEGGQFEVPAISSLKITAEILKTNGEEFFVRRTIPVQVEPFD